ncbi:hypothetical protein BH11PLA2_BH11PLA2_24100 [soil metagenome]
MLNLAAAKIWLCIEPTDMRKSFDTLAVLVKDHLQGDPLSGSWFVFRGKRGDRLKILYWHGDGFALWQKNHRSDCNHSLPFTEFPGHSHNLARWPAESGGLVGISPGRRTRR